MEDNLKQRYIATLIGCGIGDALGMPVEGFKKQTIQKKVGKITDYIDSISPYTSYLKKGEYTDDTVLTLAIAESIAEKKCLNFEHITEKQLQAYKACKLPDGSNKESFGSTTRKAFEKMLSGGSLYSSAASPGLGNAPPMKMSPIGLYMDSGPKTNNPKNNIEEMINWGMLKVDSLVNSLRIAINIGKSTHSDPRAITAGALQALAIHNLLVFNPSRNFFTEFIAEQSEKYEKYISKENKITALAEKGTLTDRLKWVRDNMDATEEQAYQHLGNSAIAFESYPFTIFMFQKYWDKPVKGLIETINYGGDCDTTGAMFGALTGAKNGMIFPDKWVKNLQNVDKLKNAAERIYSIKN